MMYLKRMIKSGMLVKDATFVKTSTSVEVFSLKICYRECC